MKDTAFYDLAISKITEETADTRSFTFEVPDELATAFKYKHGQYLTLRFHINGQDVRRSYSMSSSPMEPEITVTVKRVEGGLVSNYMHDTLDVGEKVRVMPPDGRFYTKLEHEQKKSYYLFAAGSGITPILSILKTVLEEEPKSRVHLVYGNRNEASIIFEKTLEQLSAKYKGQLFVEHILSQPHREKKGGIGGLFSKGKISWKGQVGRIDSKVVMNYLQANPDPYGKAEYFVCGPGAMLDTVELALKNQGISEKNIHTERFTILKPADVSRADGTDGATIRVSLDGKVHDLPVPTGKTILDTLLDANQEPPYSCMSGSCSTCMAKVTKGKVSMDICYALDDDEVKDGYILTCQAHPQSAIVELTFDV